VSSLRFPDRNLLLRATVDGLYDMMRARPEYSRRCHGQADGR
jgi:hypothetical protein